MKEKKIHDVEVVYVMFTVFHRQTTEISRVCHRPLYNPVKHTPKQRLTERKRCKTRQKLLSN